MFYTGVGSRETPEHILNVMMDLGEKLADLGWVLRSGAAQGADQAFEIGWIRHVARTKDFTKAEIYIPWEGFEKHRRDGCFGCNILPDLDNPELYKKAVQIAEETHPAWERCSRGARTLHTRNVYQVLGQTLDKPSRMLMAWAPTTKSGTPKGGTATAIKLAQLSGVKDVFNLYKIEDYERVMKFLEV